MVMYRMQTRRELAERFVLVRRLREVLIDNREWMIYRGEFAGLSGIIAVADADSSVIVMSVLGEPDDLPGLEETVLLPALDALVDIQ